MSAIEYTKCDGKDCGNISPDTPIDTYLQQYWMRVTYDECDYDLCPDCAAKVMLLIARELPVDGCDAA